EIGVPLLPGAAASGGGRARCLDLVLRPSQGAKRLVRGRKAGRVPPQFAGGLGARGVAALREFVEAGGTLVTLNQASQLPLKQFDLPIRNALSTFTAGQNYAPGSTVAIDVDPSHPIAH